MLSNVHARSCLTRHSWPSDQIASLAPAAVVQMHPAARTIMIVEAGMVAYTDPAAHMSCVHQMCHETADTAAIDAGLLNPLVSELPFALPCVAHRRASAAR